MKTKQVAYSYPSSQNADRFKFKDGCYTVETVELEPERQPPIAVAAFKTQAEAIAYAETMVEPWDYFTMQPYATR